MPVTRRCSKCHTVKPVTAFIPRADRPWLYLAQCRVCRVQNRRRYEQNNPALHKEAMQRRNATRRGVCAWCWVGNHKGLGEPKMYLLDNKTGLYHEECARIIQRLRLCEMELYRTTQDIPRVQGVWPQVHKGMPLMQERPYQSN